MKPTQALALSFLLPLLAFPSAFSNDVEQVVDVNGNPIFPGLTYYIIPAIRGPPGGGLKLAQTGNSHCPLTVLQDYSEVFRGFPVRFTIPGISPGLIFTGTHQYFFNLLFYFREVLCLLSKKQNFKLTKDGNFSIYISKKTIWVFYIV